MPTYKNVPTYIQFPSLSLPIYIYTDLSIDRRTVIYANDSGCTSDICIYKYVCVYSYTYNVIAFTKHIISGWGSIEFIYSKSVMARMPLEDYTYCEHLTCNVFVFLCACPQARSKVLAGDCHCHILAPPAMMLQLSNHFPIRQGAWRGKKWRVIFSLIFALRIRRQRGTLNITQ